MNNMEKNIIIGILLENERSEWVDMQCFSFNVKWISKTIKFAEIHENDLGYVYVPYKIFDVLPSNAVRIDGLDVKE